MSSALARIGKSAAGALRRLADAMRAAGRKVPAMFEGHSTPAETASYAPPHLDSPAIPPGRRVYAVGDIHGRADLLIRLIEDLKADIAGGGYEGRPILIFLGDYVDRGFQSREVLNTLLGPDVSPFETYYLKGNHEAAMLQFLDDPSIGPRWAEFGGVETLVSYGVKPPRTRTSVEEWARASEELNRALPGDHRRFLNSLDISVRIGDYVFVHAGVRPGVPLEQQTEQDMLWIREEFLNDRRGLGAVIVHGHTPTASPHRDHRRIGVDTGAYLSGRLTAARFENDSVDFVTAGLRADAAKAS